MYVMYHAGTQWTISMSTFHFLSQLNSKHAAEKELYESAAVHTRIGRMGTFDSAFKRWMCGNVEQYQTNNKKSIN